MGIDEPDLINAGVAGARAIRPYLEDFGGSGDLPEGR